jgi:hypothetical protein
VLHFLTLALCGFSVQGTLHTVRSGDPVPYAVVETMDGTVRIEADSAGRYSLACLPPTTHAIRFSRMGFESRTVDLAATQGDTIRLDIELALVPVELPSATVDGMTEGGRPAGPEHANAVWSFTPGDLAQSPLVGDPDPLLALPVPDVLTGGDPIPGLHVRGGSTDQNLTLLDGVPIYSPFHAGGGSALSPATLSRVTLESGVPSARWDGGLSSVVYAETRTAPDRGFGWDGFSDPQWTGQLVSSRILRGTGDLLVGGRVKNEILGSPDHGRGIGAADGLGRATLPAFGGNLEVLLFGSQDHFAFEATAAPSDGAAGREGRDSMSATTPGNAFAWVTQTEALIWTGPVAGHAGAEFRVWRTAYDGSAHWLAAAPLLVESGLRNVGASGAVSGSLFSTRGEIGFEANRFGTSSAVRDAVSDSAPGQFFNQTAAPVVVAGFVEDRWQTPEGTWGVTAGLRTEVFPQVGVEPRLIVRYAPHPGVALTAGYSGSRQYVQSLSNPESIVGAVVGIALPVATDGTRFPVGTASEGTVSLSLRPGSATTVSLDVYVRSMDGLLLVAPATAQPFAISSVAAGSGRASGALLSFQHQTGRVTVQGLYAYGTTTRTASGATYSPTADATHSLAAGISAPAPGGIRVRADIAASLGRRSSLLGDSLTWSPGNQLGGVGDMDGSPQDIRGPLDGQLLPGYVRADVGLRREWSTSVRGHAASLVGSVTVYNLFGRTNVAALVQPAAALTAQALALTPRTISFRLEWHHE